MTHGQNTQYPQQLFELRERIKRSLSPNHDANVLDRAAVALLLYGPLDSLEILLIKRSQRDGDPWSGHLALPGGRPDESDLNHYQTAVRETFEEVAIDLGGCHYLGELPAVAPRMRQQVGPLIFPHLFWTDQTFEFSPNPQEVDSVFHLSVHQLFDSQNFEQKFFQMNNGETINLPSMRLPQGILWGLTYVIIIQLMEQILGTSIGHSYWQENELPKWWRRP